MIRVLENEDPRYEEAKKLTFSLFTDYIRNLEKQGKTEGEYTVSTPLFNDTRTYEEKIDDYKKALDILGYKVVRVKNDITHRYRYPKPTGGYSPASTTKEKRLCFRKKKENEL